MIFMSFGKKIALVAALGLGSAGCDQQVPAVADAPERDGAVAVDASLDLGVVDAGRDAVVDMVVDATLDATVEDMEVPEVCEPREVNFDSDACPSIDFNEPGWEQIAEMVFAEIFDEAFGVCRNDVEDKANQVREEMKCLSASVRAAFLSHVRRAVGDNFFIYMSNVTNGKICLDMEGVRAALAADGLEEREDRVPSLEMFKLLPGNEEEGVYIGVAYYDNHWDYDGPAVQLWTYRDPDAFDGIWLSAKMHDNGVLAEVRVWDDPYSGFVLDEAGDLSKAHREYFDSKFTEECIDDCEETCEGGAGLVIENDDETCIACDE